MPVDPAQVTFPWPWRMPLDHKRIVANQWRKDPASRLVIDDPVIRRHGRLTTAQRPVLSCIASIRASDLGRSSLS
jgi:hypothetical protein